MCLKKGNFVKKGVRTKKRKKRSENDLYFATQHCLFLALFIYTYICLFAYICMCVYICLCVYVYMYIFIYLCMALNILNIHAQFVSCKCLKYYKN